MGRIKAALGAAGGVIAALMQRSPEGSFCIKWGIEETLLDGPDAMRRPRGGVRGGFGGMRGGSLTSNAEEVRASAEYRQYEEMGL